MKRADPNRPISKDTLARLFDGHLLICDCSARHRRPTPIENPDSQDITGQVFVEVTPTNHLKKV
ncbi:MAG: hypothetical protein QM736_09950 [Vicinamibacterales bacterium]